MKRKEKKNIKYYETKRVCWNCKEKNNLKIPKGVTVETFLKKYKCKNCECNTTINIGEDLLFG